jgi:hypothetical protein
MSGVLLIVNEQFGRILLAIAVMLTIVLWSQNGSLDLPPVPTQDLNRQVMVELDKNTLPTASQEKFFVLGSGSDYAGGSRFIFVAEKKIIEFQPVELDVPAANVLPPPQLLPEPGPSLEGTAKLPRFGDEFPPVALIKDSKDPKNDPSKDPKK